MADHQTPAERRIIEDMRRKGRTRQMDDKLIERIKADREAGTPGPWVGGDDPDGEICTGDDVCAWICCVNYDDTTNAQASSDARRISHVPDMEARILADADRIEALEAERDENEGAFRVWRRRCQKAEAENAALREGKAQGVQIPLMPPE
jgi:hypothetical protein